MTILRLPASGNRHIRRSARHRHDHTADGTHAHATTGDFQHGGISGVADQCVGQVGRRAIGGAGTGHAHVRGDTAIILEGGEQARAEDFESRSRGRDGHGIWRLRNLNGIGHRGRNRSRTAGNSVTHGRKTHGVAGLQQRGRVGPLVPHRRFRVAQQLPAARADARIHAGKRAGKPHRARGHAQPWHFAAWHIEYRVAAGQVCETGREADERHGPGGIAMPAHNLVN